MKALFIMISSATTVTLICTGHEVTAVVSFVLSMAIALVIKDE